MRDFARVKKPIMFIAPQLSYFRMFISAYCGIFK